jgi:hypothetical protein
LTSGGELAVRVLACLLPALLLGAAPERTEAVPPGSFQTWGIHPVETLSLKAGGVSVKVAATPANRRRRMRVAGSKA